MAQSAPRSSSSLGDLYSKCVQMVNENKISVKNAFDLHLIDHMDDIVDSFMGGKKRSGGAGGTGGGKDRGRKESMGGSAAGGEAEAEHRFHEASCTIEASARIYACRVDCVHTDTYRVLGGLNSADMGDDEDGKDGEDGKGPAKRRRICGVNTLERNEANIIQQHIEADEQSDPMFRRMAAAFDAGGAKGLLLSHLPIAEDLSLVFMGDVPLTRAAGTAPELFRDPLQVQTNALGLGEPAAARKRIAETRLCPQIDKFRQPLWEKARMDVSLPDSLEAILGPVGAASFPSAAGSQAPGSMPVAPVAPLQDIDRTLAADAGDIAGVDDAMPGELPDPGDLPTLDSVSNVDSGGHPLPLADLPLADAGPDGSGRQDVIAFDELFEKFCGGGGSHQFAYFDECWAKTGREKDGKGCAGALADAQADGAAAGADGALAPYLPEARERPQKRPLFDLSGLEHPAKPIETEPVHKHQLSERAAQWQLHRDVPPYMIDRITMPSWPSWSKCDFACLGLRPHLMLKLVRKPAPAGDGPHSFSDLFSTVVVENPDAFPWLAAEDRRPSSGADRCDADEDGRGEREVDFGDDGGDEDFHGNGLPAHLDVDPQNLFLRPDDKVVPGCDQEDLQDEGVSDTAVVPGIDFDLIDQPATVGSVDIGYSRNSKFVDVKLVKKHLWDCISEDIEDAKSAGTKSESSFQGLVSRTVSRLPKGEIENLGIAVCFICALHLCNEKGTELAPEKSRPLGDFAVVGPP